LYNCALGVDTATKPGGCKNDGRRISLSLMSEVDNMRAFRRLLSVFVLGLIAVCVTACVNSSPLGRDDLVHVTLIAFNDFHGNLKTPGGGVPRDESGDEGKTGWVRAGGVEYMGTLVRQLREKNPNHAVVAAGDLIGASPLISSLLHDEPTIEALDALGLEVSSVGNHEFDQGAAELKRLQHGGCHAKDGCRDGRAFTGARFRYLAANVVEAKTGRPFFPSYLIKRFEGVPIAFVGAVLRGTPSIVSPSGVAGLRFSDEAEAINALVPELRRQGVETIVALLHQGGATTGGYNDPSCPNFSGPIVDIVRRLDPAIDVVVSGHTHRPYICRIDGRLVTQAGSFGRYLTEIDLSIDRRSHAVVAANARNYIVDATTLAKDATQTTIVARADAVTAPIANVRIGALAGPITRQASPAGESALGDLIADAQLVATSAADAGGAQIAFTNPGGIRTDLLPHDGVVTYGDVFATQPFGNSLVIMELTGAQIKRLLEQQWSTKGDSVRILQVSFGFGYAWDASKPVGARVVADSLALNGVAIDPTQRYRIVVNGFLADGGDGFTVLRDGRNWVGGPLDADALADYLRSGPQAHAKTRGRITRWN
jgi:5'-nucleotidase